jgi:hypothetical protein
LEITLESIAESTKSGGNARILDYVTEIRSYAELCRTHPIDSRYAHQLRQAMTDLATLVHEKGKFLLAVRLEMIAQQL